MGEKGLFLILCLLLLCGCAAEMPAPIPTPAPTAAAEMPAPTPTPVPTPAPESWVVTDESAEEILALAELPSLRRVDGAASTETAALLRLSELRPDCEVYWEAEFHSERIPSDTRSMTVTDLTGLEELLPLLPQLEELDLPDAKFADTDELESILALAPSLKRLDLDDCGLPDDEIGALCERHPAVKIVWTMHFGVYTLRTDAKSFCANNLPEYGFVAPPMEAGTLDVLRYCTDMVALDLGHTHVEDISFLAYMPHLKYLILVEGGFSDITVIGTLQELEYLELFQNKIDDVTPLLNCRALRHLNIGYSTGFDPKPLAEMTWLERLWLPGNRIDRDTAKMLRAALPDTKCYFASYDGNGSTGGNWRQNEAYFEMRDAFGMHYQGG